MPYLVGYLVADVPGTAVAATYRSRRVRLSDRDRGENKEFLYIFCVQIEIPPLQWHEI